MPLHWVVRVSPPKPGNPGIEDGNVSESTDANAPRDAIVMSAGCRKIVTETLDELCMWQVNPWSGSRICYELSHKLDVHGYIRFCLFPSVDGLLVDMMCRRFVPTRVYLTGAYYHSLV